MVTIIFAKYERERKMIAIWEEVLKTASEFPEEDQKMLANCCSERIFRLCRKKYGSKQKKRTESGRKILSTGH